MCNILLIFQRVCHVLYWEDKAEERKGKKGREREEERGGRERGREGVRKGERGARKGRREAREGEKE